MSASVFVVRRTLSVIKSLFSTRETVKSRHSFSEVRNFSISSSKNMKICQFVYNDNPRDIRVGLVEGDSVIDVNKVDTSLPRTLLEILRNGQIDKVKSLNKSTNASKAPLSSVTLKAPITGMDKVLCVGLNYKDHCAEQNLTPPEVPMIFSKFASCVIGTNEPVRLRTDVTKKVDWEVEMVVVIGKTASFVKAADAHEYILGTTVAQDISARDWQKQRNAGQFLLGKAMDTFCPIGPWIVTPDETGNIEELAIECSVNGVLKQKSNTNQLVHKIPAIIERISSVFTLLPGDIILTGTPGGVGMYRDPPEYLKPGDRISSTIQNVGTLDTPFTKF